MANELEQIARKVEILLDREKIRDCLMRYCQGLDRQDEAMLSSVFWADSHIKIGDYDGSGPAFVEWVMPRLKELQRVQHFIANIMIRSHETSATVETYLRNWHTLEDGDGQPIDLVHGGRYLDKFEKRGDEWRIADRYVMWDFAFKSVDPLAIMPGLIGQHDLPLGSAYPADKLYSFLGRPATTPSL